MTKTLRLKITQNVINTATSENSAKCMIARAVRAIGGRSVNVTAETISFRMGDIRYTYPTPAKAAVELIRFDGNKKSVKPFVVTLQGASGFTRPVVHVKAKKAKKVDVTKILKGARKAKKAPRRKSARRGTRRFRGLRVVEAA